MAVGYVMAFQFLNAFFVTSLPKHEDPMKKHLRSISALESKAVDVNNVLLLISN